MNRSMFSGVAGLKTHQVKMDVIGNNIANVNTYGYKAQRAVFSDMFYQTIQSASQGTISRGGTNPSGVGYGSTLAGIQTQMSTSSMQSTGFGMDVAVTGEGFIQVMDADGNTFYTKAGLLSYDANGYLVDINGNFVLGGIGSDADAGSDKIKLDNVGSVDASTSSTEFTINGITYTMSTSNADRSGNVGMAIGSSETLPDGLAAQATISSTGSVTVMLNASQTFDTISDLNMAINTAITEANGGVQHKAGTFTLSTTKDVFTYVDGTGATQTGLTGAQISGTAGGVDSAVISGTNVGNGTLFDGLVAITASSSTLSAAGTVNAGDFNVTFTDAIGDDPAFWEFSFTVTDDAGGTTEYTGKLTENSVASSLLLKNADGDETITISIQDGYSGLSSKYSDVVDGTAGSNVVDGNSAEIKVIAAQKSPNLGLGQTSLSLTGGTSGGVVTLAELTNISFGPDGTVSVTHSEKGLIVVGKISLATFANPQGLELVGTNYYVETVNSGEPLYADPGTDGTGALATSCLEMSNVDLSEQFSEMITTQRGFQANSRIITVSDTMLEELINLKR